MRYPWIALLAVAGAVGLTLAQETPRTPQPKLVAVTADNLQYNGIGPYQLFDRPTKNQGLDTLLSRGRVTPEELIERADKNTRDRTRESGRTIFQDQYTHAEVWRITDVPSGVVSHTYSGVPAWNANGRYIELSEAYHGTLLFDHENCTTTSTTAHGEWSPTEPYTLYCAGDWQGHKAVVAYDLKLRKAIRGLGPVRTFAGISPPSVDGKWVAWREGVQDTATSFGLAATDGSSFKSISTAGGILAEQTPVTFNALPDPPALDKVKAGIHQMYISKRPDHAVLINVHGEDPHGRLVDASGKIIAGMENLTHQCWEPSGKYVVYMKRTTVGMDPMTKKEWTIIDVAKAIEGHTTWNSFDPNWLAMSWRSLFTGEIIRISARDDHSVARLCGSCPLNPETTAYSNDEFGCNSPDGTKILFMSTMSGNVNEYIVVAANPRAPKITGQWKGGAYEITITPDPLSHEAKTYRIYRTDQSGQDYRPIGKVDVPDSPTLNPTAPLTFAVKDLAQGQKAFFAVRMQEWSGLISRYSNDVSPGNQPTAAYIEPETQAFAGYMQGFDPQGAGDMYYLFVPEEGRACSVAVENTQTSAVVFARIGGGDVSFTVNGKAKAIKNESGGWIWVNLGAVPGSITIESKSAGFKLDRVFITPDARQVPEGRGLDYRADKAFAAVIPGGAQAQGKSPFAVEVSWAAVPGARYYNVYAGDKGNFVPAQSNLLFSPPADAGNGHVVDWGLKPGTSYYYKIVAVDDDGNPSQPSAAISASTSPLDVHTVEVQTASAQGATLEEDKGASTGKAVVLSKGHGVQLHFTVPADGDYVFWQNFRAENGRGARLNVKFDDAKPYLMQTSYDLTNLGGKAIRKEWIWSRFTFLWSSEGNGVLHLKAGPHTLELSTDNPVYLDKIIITNDQSLVPPGHLCTF